MHYLRTEAWHQARMQALARKQRGFIIDPYRYGTSGSDPYFANVVSLLHFDGTNGSSTFTDQIPARTWTARNGATISTSQSVFGGASGTFAGGGSSQHIDTPDHADWDFGSGAFTLEGACYTTTHSGLSNALGKVNVGGYGPWIIFRNANALQFFSSSDGSTWDIASALAIGTLTLNGWNRWAVTRSGSNFYTHLDGIAGATTSSAATVIANTDVVRIAEYTGATLYGWVGYLDEMRATKGVARYTGSNYTLSGTAFPDS